MEDKIKSNAATELDLSELHSLTTKLIKQRLEQALNGGEPLPPAELGAIIKFLKDNNIECTRDDMENKFGEVLKLSGPTFTVKGPSADELQEKFG